MAPGGASREDIATDARAGDLGVQLGDQLVVVGRVLAGGFGLVAPVLGLGAVLNADELLVVRRVGVERRFVIKAAAALAPAHPVPLAAGSGLGRPARRSGPGRLTPIRRSKRLIAAVIGRHAQTSTFILPS